MPKGKDKDKYEDKRDLNIQFSFKEAAPTPTKPLFALTAGESRPDFDFVLYKHLFQTKKIARDATSHHIMIDWIIRQYISYLRSQFALRCELQISAFFSIFQLSKRHIALYSPCRLVGRRHH